jgi:signal transduction histidine kinase
VRWRDRRDDIADWALATAIAVGAVVQQVDASGSREPLTLNLALVLLATLPIGLRRRWPVLVFFVSGMASLAHVLFGFQNQFLTTFAVLVTLYSVANHGPWPMPVLSAAAVALLLPVNFIVDWTNQGHVNVGDIPYNYALLGAAWLLGDRLRRERELRTQLHTQQGERERRAVADERDRIARDLHDVVAHTLSVIVLQAGGGRRVAVEHPERAGAVLSSIEALGREALRDMRRLLGVLRADEGAAPPPEPQPSLSRLDALVERVRAAGLAVEVCTEGEPRDLPSGVDLSAYRIVQEALTNVLRHARAERARVVVRYAPAGVEVEVTDDGTAGFSGGAGGGRGLLGMRERVSMFGGTFEAGPRPDGGFRVRAVLPMESAPP